MEFCERIQQSLFAFGVIADTFCPKIACDGGNIPQLSFLCDDIALWQKFVEIGIHDRPATDRHQGADAACKTCVFVVFILGKRYGKHHFFWCVCFRLNVHKFCQWNIAVQKGSKCFCIHDFLLYTSKNALS